MKKIIFLNFLLLLIFNINVYANIREVTKKELSLILKEVMTEGRLMSSTIAECPKCKKFTCNSKMYYMGQYPDMKNYPNTLGEWTVRIDSCGSCGYLLGGEFIEVNYHSLKNIPKGFKIFPGTNNVYFQGFKLKNKSK